MVRPPVTRLLDIYSAEKPAETPHRQMEFSSSAPSRSSLNSQVRA
jgi:hypothetical protein